MSQELLPRLAALTAFGLALVACTGQVGPSVPSAAPTSPAVAGSTTASPSRPAIASHTLTSPVPSLSESPSAAPAFGAYRTVVDPFEDVHFSVIVDTDNAFYGRFSFAKVGVGAFWGSGAVATTNANNTLDVSYRGSGWYDPAAKVEIFIGHHESSGAKDPVELDLAMTISRDGVGAGRLIADGIEYRVGSKHAPPPPDDAVATVLALTRAKDWPALFELYVPAFVRGIERDDFISGIESGTKQYDSLEEVVAVGPISVTDQGPWYTAEVDVALTLIKQGERTTYPSRLVMISAGDDWRIASMSPIEGVERASPAPSGAGSGG